MSEVMHMPGAERKFQVKDLAILNEDIMVTRTGHGQVLYASKGEVVTVMSYDPSLDKPYGVRVPREGYRNAPIADIQAEPFHGSLPSALDTGL